MTISIGQKNFSANQDRTGLLPLQRPLGPVIIYVEGGGGGERKEGGGGGGGQGCFRLAIGGGAKLFIKKFRGGGVSSLRYTVL